MAGLGCRVLRSRVHARRVRGDCGGVSREISASTMRRGGRPVCVDRVEKRTIWGRVLVRGCGQWGGILGTLTEHAHALFVLSSAVDPYSIRHTWLSGLSFFLQMARPGQSRMLYVILLRCLWSYHC